MTGGGPASGPSDMAALAELDAITRRLRRECPWDREQDERSIVPHTVEEAYELADAAHAGDDARMLDELGDVLFQVYFLSLLLEERETGSLAAVARHCAEKLVRRHPHVFGEAQARDAGEVLARWDAVKRAEPGRDEGSALGGLPENLPALIAARKLQRRAAAAGWEGPGPDEVIREIEERVERLAPGQAGTLSRQQRRWEVGELLFAVVGLARSLDVDAELALHQTGVEFRDRVEARA